MGHRKFDKENKSRALTDLKKKNTKNNNNLESGKTSKIDKNRVYVYSGVLE